MITIYRIKETDALINSRGVPVRIEEMSEAGARSLGILPALPKTPDELLFDYLKRLTPEQIETEIQISGPRSPEARVGKLVLAAKAAAAEREDKELQAEKEKYHGVDGSSCPPSVAQGGGMSESQVFQAASYAALEEKKQ